MAQTAQKFEAVDAELQSTLTTLKNQVAALQAAWVGHGAMSFQQTMEQWSRDQNQINQLLRETAQLIRTAGTSYATSDSDTASRFNNQGGSVRLPL
jgi:WXG100 family type VII secretion target